MKLVYISIFLLLSNIANATDLSWSINENGPFQNLADSHLPVGPVYIKADNITTDSLVGVQWTINGVWKGVDRSEPYVFLMNGVDCEDTKTCYSVGFHTFRADPQKADWSIDTDNMQLGEFEINSNTIITDTIPRSKSDSIPEPILMTRPEPKPKPNQIPNTGSLKNALCPCVCIDGICPSSEIATKRSRPYNALCPC